MEKKKRIISKLIFVLVLAAVVSMCFVGTTLARYASSGSGTATTDVAKWDVDFNEDTTTSVSFGDLSPSMSAYSADSVRTKNSAITLVGSIENKSDVSAIVTPTFDNEETFEYINFDGTSWTVGGYTENGENSGAPSEAQVKGVFSIALYYNASDFDAENPSTLDNLTNITSGETHITLDANGGSNTKVNIYAVVVWTSADATLKASADDLDTWIGENVTTVTYSITFSAVQGSEQPTA